MKKTFKTNNTLRELIDEIYDTYMLCEVKTKCSPDCPGKRQCRKITIEIKEVQDETK